ncbi:MAG: M48 family metallopeptidase, partial [Pseudomonadota bacterium]
MMSDLSFQGRYFDGQSGEAQAVTVFIDSEGLRFEASGTTEFWPFRDVKLSAAPGAEIRLANRRDEDASLYLPAAAMDALQRAAPDQFTGARERRRMGALIGALILGAGAVTAGIFFGVPAASGPLAQHTPKQLEMQIGENIAAQINTLLRPCGDEEAMTTIRPVIEQMADKGDVGFPIRFQFIHADAPNAFALPGGQIMATSGLLNAIGDDQEAFLAVMAHELGHVRARDSMRAVYRNAGLGIALDIITGGSGVAQQAVLVGGQLSQLRHTRQQETAADETAAEIMLEAGLDPSALARAFEAITGYDYDPEEHRS